MSKPVKPAPKSKRQNAMEQMVQECVRKAQARKRSGQTDREWQQQYAASLKVETPTAALSETPFAGDTNKKKV